MIIVQFLPEFPNFDPMEESYGSGRVPVALKPALHEILGSPAPQPGGQRSMALPSIRSFPLSPFNLRLLAPVNQKLTPERQGVLLLIVGFREQLLGVNGYHSPEACPAGLQDERREDRPYL